MPDEFPEGRLDSADPNTYLSLGNRADPIAEGAPAGSKLNPWFSIWLQPRATIRQVVDSDPTRNVLLLMALAGISDAFDRAAVQNLGDRTSLAGIFLFACILGPIGGIISLYILGYLIQRTGEWLGGEANDAEVRAAIAYGSIPGIWALLIVFLRIVVFGKEMFTEETPRLDANPALVQIFFGFLLVEMIVVGWQMVAVWKCIAEVHRFSAWRALGASILAGLLLIVPITVISMIVVAVAGLGNN